MALASSATLASALLRELADRLELTRRLAGTSAAAGVGTLMPRCCVTWR